MIFEEKNISSQIARCKIDPSLFENENLDLSTKIFPMWTKTEKEKVSFMLILTSKWAVVPWLIGQRRLHSGRLKC